VSEDLQHQHTRTQTFSTFSVVIVHPTYLAPGLDLVPKNPTRKTPQPLSFHILSRRRSGIDGASTTGRIIKLCQRDQNLATNSTFLRSKYGINIASGSDIPQEIMPKLETQGILSFIILVISYYSIEVCSTNGICRPYCRSFTYSWLRPTPDIRIRSHSMFLYSRAIITDTDAVIASRLWLRPEAGPDSIRNLGPVSFWVGPRAVPPFGDAIGSIWVLV